MRKIVCMAVSLLLIFALVSCDIGANIHTETDGNDKTTTLDYKEIYEDVISRYTALLTAKHIGEELPAPDTAGMDEREAVIAETLHGIVDARKDAEAVENLGYGFKDLDGNGTPELILLTRYTTVQAILTISDNKPLLLEANYGEGTSFVFARQNRFLMLRDTVTDGIGEAIHYTCHVDGDKMVYDFIYGQVYDQKKELLERFQIVDGNRTPIDEDTFKALYWEYDKSCRPGYTDITKLEAPRIYLPLVNQTVDHDLPVANFSSYAAIRETYTKISDCLEKFDSLAWFTGEYDNLFAFPNDLSFEYYTRLLYAAHHGNHYVGYDEIDLNGDGQDELVLMNEDFSINAIFTQKNGIPVLLLDAFSYETCWLDDRGLIHVDREDHEELQYSLYELTKSGDLDLTYSIRVTQGGGYFQTKDGKTELISYEESKELYYDDYTRYSVPFKRNEQTRNASDLTYTPLTPPTENAMQTALGQTWHKNANLTKTSPGASFAYSNTYITFENATDAQTHVDFKYKFTYCYPDPDRDYHSLEETTESSLSITAREENGALVFDEGGLKGRFEFGQKYLWLIIEESTDERFHAGHHIYSVYTPEDW